jgi:hypothetical protein
MRSIDLESNEIGILTHKATQALDYSCGTVPESHRTFPNPSLHNLPQLCINGGKTSSLPSGKLYT